jgi:hypothetical protein
MYNPKPKWKDITQKMLPMQALAHRNTGRRKRKTTVRQIKVVQRKDRTQIT